MRNARCKLKREPNRFAICISQVPIVLMNRCTARWRKLMVLRRIYAVIAAIFAWLICNSLVLADSNSLLSITPDGRWLLAANSDNNSVSVVDAIERKVLREIP